MKTQEHTNSAIRTHADVLFCSVLRVPDPSIKLDVEALPMMLVFSSRRRTFQTIKATCLQRCRETYIVRQVSGGKQGEPYKTRTTNQHILGLYTETYKCKARQLHVQTTRCIVVATMFLTQEEHLQHTIVRSMPLSLNSPTTTM